MHLGDTKRAQNIGSGNRSRLYRRKTQLFVGLGLGLTTKKHCSIFFFAFIIIIIGILFRIVITFSSQTKEFLKFETSKQPQHHSFPLNFKISMPP